MQNSTLVANVGFTGLSLSTQAPYPPHLAAALHPSPRCHRPRPLDSVTALTSSPRCPLPRPRPRQCRHRPIPPSPSPSPPPPVHVAVAHALPHRRRRRRGIYGFQLPPGDQVSLTAAALCSSLPDANENRLMELDEGLVSSDRPGLPPPGEMKSKEGFALRKWRR